MIWILLTIIAYILFNILFIVNFFAVIYKYGFKRSVIIDFFKQTAIDLDRYGNHNYRTLFNITLIKSNGYKFGNVNETISSVLGKNKRNNTLSKIGIIICTILDFLDKNHCIKSINNNI